MLCVEQEAIDILVNGVPLGAAVRADVHFRCDRHGILLLRSIPHAGESANPQSPTFHGLISDHLRLKNMESFLEHLEMRNTATIFQGLVISAEILPLPAVIMLGVASRGLLFWCLNLLCIPLVISMSRRFLFGSKQKSTSSDDIIFEASQTESPVSLEVS